MDLWDALKQVAMTGSDEEQALLRLTLQAIRQKRERGSAYLSGFLGLSGEFVEEGVYQFRVPITPFMRNRGGNVHGGIIASLADSTIGSLINRSLPSGKVAVTAEMKVNYLRPGRGRELVSRARLVHRGQRLAVGECEIFDDRGRRIALSTATFYILD
ncbi:MAG: PaaI family thioesterase [Planifilum sp.]